MSTDRDRAGVGGTGRARLRDRCRSQGRGVLERRLAWPGARGPLADRLALVLLGTLAWDVAPSRVVALLPFGSTPVAIGLLFAGFWVMVLLCVAACRAPLWPAVSRASPGRLLRVAPVLLVVVAAGTAIQVAETVAGRAPITNDTTALIVCSAQDMLRGQNPYQTSELSCLQRLRLSRSLATPLPRGPLAHVHGYPTTAEILAAAARAMRANRAASAILPHTEYPPLAPVWMLPVALAAARWRVVWTAGSLLIFLLIIGREAGRYWPAVVLATLLQFGPGSVGSYAVTGGVEVYAYLLAGLALLWIRHPRLSAVCMVLAVGSNQLTWFIVPGYATLCWSQGRFQLRLLTGTVTALLTVVPLLLVYRGAAAAALGSVFVPVFPLGLGLVVLRQAGYLPHLSERVLNGTAAVALLGGAAWGALSAQWRAVALLLPVAAFWFAWRSEANFLTQVSFFALMLVLGLRHDGPLAASGPVEPIGGGCPAAILSA